MKIVCILTLLLLSSLVAPCVVFPSPNPIAMDWHQGGRLYIVYGSGQVLAVDPASGVVTRSFRIYDDSLRPAEIVSAVVRGQEVVFISGFMGRVGLIVEYGAEGQPLAKFPAPELAVGLDIDPGTSGNHAHILYVASASSSAVYAINIDQPGRADEVTYIKGARSLGPVVFDRSKNRLFIGDQGNGNLYEVDCATGSFTTVATDLGSPISLAIDGASTILYVADSFSGQIQGLKLGDPQQKLTRLISYSTRLERLSAIALAPESSSLFVADLSKGVDRLYIFGQTVMPKAAIPSVCTTSMNVFERHYIQIPDTQFEGLLFVYVGDIRRTNITGKPSDLSVVVGPHALPNTSKSVGLSPENFNRLKPTNSYHLSFSKEGESLSFSIGTQKYHLIVNSIHHLVGSGQQSL